MKRILLPLTFLCLAPSVGVQAGIFIGDDGRARLDNHSMDYEHAKLNAKNSNADQLRDYHGIYRMVRDQYFFGTQGTVVRSGQWFIDAAEWIETISSLVDSLNDSYVEQMANNTDDLKAFRTQLNQLAILLTQILNESNDIQERMDTAQDYLHSIPALPTTFIPGHEDPVIELNNAVAELKQQLEELEQSFDQGASNAMRNLLDVVRATVSAMSKRLALNFPELQELLLEVQNALLAAEFIDPQVELAEKIRLQILSAETEMRPFYADALYQELIEQVEQSKALIEHYVENEVERNLGFERLELVLGRAEESRNAIFANRQSLIESKYINAMTVLSFCQTSSAVAEVMNCTLLSTIAGLTSGAGDAFKELDDDKLKYIEDVITRAMANVIL